MTARQLSLVYQPRHVGGEAHRVRLEAIRAAVLHLGHKEVAYELDVAGSYLSDALNERDRKRWADEWTDILLVMLAQRDSDVAAQLGRAIVAPQIELTPFALEERIDDTPEDIVAALRRTEAGRAAIAAVTKKGRGR